MTIQEQIKQYMSDNGISYESAADDMGWSKQNLWDKLNNRVSPNFDTMMTILDGLKARLVITDLTMGIHISDETIQKLLIAAANEKVSYDCVAKLLEALGFETEIQFEEVIV